MGKSGESLSSNANPRAAYTWPRLLLPPADCVRQCFYEIRARRGQAFVIARGNTVQNISPFGVNRSSTSRRSSLLRDLRIIPRDSRRFFNSTALWCRIWRRSASTPTVGFCVGGRPSDGKQSLMLLWLDSGLSRGEFSEIQIAANFVPKSCQSFVVDSGFQCFPFPQSPLRARLCRVSIEYQDGLRFLRRPARMKSASHKPC